MFLCSRTCIEALRNLDGFRAVQVYCRTSVIPQTDVHTRLKSFGVYFLCSHFIAPSPRAPCDPADPSPSVSIVESSVYETLFGSPSRRSALSLGVRNTRSPERHGGDGRAAGYVERVISEAEEAEAQAVVITLDTPGGGLDPTQRIVESAINAEGTPVITYVSPQGARAASAGTFVVMASDVAAMAPQTTIGAAAVVDVFGRDIPGILGEKVTNDAVALIRGLAEAHGRNEEWAEAAVREAASANAEEALEIGVVEYVEPDLETVLEAADGERVEPKGITLRTGCQ